MKTKHNSLAKSVIKVSALQYLLLIVVLPLFLYFSLTDLVNETRENDIRRTIELEKHHLNNYLLNHSELLNNFSKMGIFVQAVMQPNIAKNSANDMMRDLQFFGENFPLILFDFSGNEIAHHFTDNIDFTKINEDVVSFVSSNHNSKTAILEGNKNYWVLLHSVKYNNLSEGALVTLIPIDKYLYDRESNGSDYDGVKVTILKDTKSLLTFGESEIGKTYIENFNTLPISLEFTFDESIINKKRGNILVSILILIIITALVVTILNYNLMIKTVVTPIRKLTVDISQFAKGNFKYKELSFDLLEIDALSRQFNLMAIEIDERECELRDTRNVLKKQNKKLKDNQKQLLQADKMASIGQLAAGVAHEINNPIGFVLSNSVTLKEYIDDIKSLLIAYDSEKSIEEIDEIKESIGFDDIMEDLDPILADNDQGLKWVAEIVKNLKSFAHVDNSGEFIECSIQEMLDEALLLARNEIKYVAEIKKEYSDTPPVIGIRSEIEQVFLNIFVNAAQALKENSQNNLGKLLVRTSVLGKFCVIEIEDDGPGISEVILKDIFNPFFTTKPVGEGTGLGLSLAYDTIVQKHNGDIQVNSTLGEGTTFTILLPLEVQS